MSSSGWTRSGASAAQSIRLEQAAAHEIDRVGEAEFDIVVLNSVVQCFRPSVAIQGQRASKLSVDEGS
jgi:hypothetical protein